MLRCKSCGETDYFWETAYLPVSWLINGDGKPKNEEEEINWSAKDSDSEITCWCGSDEIEETDND